MKRSQVTSRANGAANNRAGQVVPQQQGQLVPQQQSLPPAVIPDLGYIAGILQTVANSVEIVGQMSQFCQEEGQFGIYEEEFEIYLD